MSFTSFRKLLILLGLPVCHVHQKQKRFLPSFKNVSLLTDERLTGATVEVCDGSACKKCGAFGNVGRGQWGSIKCGGRKGIKGSSVKVVGPNSYLQIAKAEVVGTSKLIKQLLIVTSKLILLI